ncbi:MULTISPECIES: MaoC family dehydratase [Micrococcaceae]|uniref:MaoC family dehydratase n=1 Tax=Micrococcaceae TaxID=1268 RepID=UPI001613DD31|nr:MULTISPECIES: MaoC family dehydratase [Micrococcaceae]MBB5750025.1 acyl dehydratase [Micrococcus sp. TA1]HRO30720.1 MaoC family dehydratase [Citricoccus sp.]HRO94365.1 MaoC family dehydratase [Citricoccus sp.]
MDVRESGTLRTTIDGLPELVGRTFGPSSWFRVTQDDVDAYAQVSRDHNPIHVDPEAAARSPFGRTVAHGYLTLSLVVPLMAEVFEVTDMGTGMNYGLDRLRFPAPVPVGSTIRLRGEVLGTVPLAAGQQVTVRVTFEVEGSAKPACVADLLLRYYA